MTLRSDSKYPVHRAYVVKLSSEATSDLLCGRVEHLVSGRHRDFTSADELFDLMAADLAATEGELPDES